MITAMQWIRGHALLDCGHNPSPHGDHTTGTAHTSDGKVICWECAAMGDLGRMLKDGNSRRLPLYLNRKTESDKYSWRVSNWPGTLEFPIMGMRSGSHNMARKRIDVWFVGPDRYVWHGVQVGEWTQIVHCKRTKEQWKGDR